MRPPCLSLTDQPDGAELCDEVYGERLGYRALHHAGLRARQGRGRRLRRRTAKVEGLILLKHGIFTFGADAREAYERMIEMVTLAEERLKRGRKTSSRRRNCRADRGASPRSRRSCAAPAR